MSHSTTIKNNHSKQQNNIVAQLFTHSFLIFKQSVLNESCEIHRVIMEMVVVLSLSLSIMRLQWLSIRLQTHLSVSPRVGGGGVGRWGV